MVSALWACGGATESLWVDELHTSWTVSGDFSEVAHRARAGNQSPLFFWLLYGLSATLGNLPSVSQEWALRLPSVACWAAVVFLCLREVCGQRVRLGNNWCGVSLPLATLAWLILDRVQLFYATEARVYSAVQLVSLLSWIAVARLGMVAESSDAMKNSFAGTRTVWAWCGLSVMLVFLHITAVLAVACQIAWGTMLVVRQRSELRQPWAAAVIAVALATAVALLLSARVWEHRAQWDSFAGEATWKSFLGLLPLAAYGVPVGLARVVDWLSRSGKRTGAGEPNDSPWWIRGCWNTRDLGEDSNGRRGVWWLAAFGPWIIAWFITALDLAPIFHRRFVIVSAVPLVMLASMEIGRIRHNCLRCGAVIGVCIWLIVSQGTLDNWRAGHWYGWQRWEGWRQATNALNEQLQPGDEVWCASGLVEANGATLPIDSELNRYLSFPLRGAYRAIDASGQFIEPHALLVSGEEWAEQLLAAATAEQSTTKTHWIVYRGSPRGFEERLAKMRRRVALEKGLLCRIDEPQAFGLVSFVRVLVGWK